MGRIAITVLLTFFATLGLVWLGLVAVAETGAVNVAATADYVPGAEWFFATTTRESIRRHAGPAEIVATDGGAELELDAAAEHYRSMCVVCHGGPGVGRGEFGRGMKPRPPDLSHVARELDVGEIHWVLQNGLRHTGMPAFGATHDEATLRGLARLVARFDGMSPDEFARLGATPSGGGHAHDAGTHAEGGHHGERARAQEAGAPRADDAEEPR